MYVNMSCRATAQPPHLQVPFLTTASALLPQLIDGGEFAGSKRAWLMCATPPEGDVLMAATGWSGLDEQAQ